MEVLVISAWSNLDDWRKWFNSTERDELEKKLEPYLQDPVEIRAFMPYTDYENISIA
jgi:heme-degrading monooxygenase HmoA